MTPVTPKTNNIDLSRSNKTKKSKKKLWKWIVSIIAVVVLMVASYYIYSIFNFANVIQVKPNENSNEVTKLPEWTGKEPVNILLLGVDRREDSDSTRSDSILLLSINPETKKSHLFSIMRDTWVNIPGYKDQKINAAFALGEAPLAAKTVEEFLDIPVQYYVTTDLNGFKHIVDSVGGIELNVEEDMYYTSKADGPEYDIDLKAGLQHLDGKNALGYVRYRGGANGDYGRSERQRNFIKALATEVQSANGIMKIPSLLKAAAPYIETNMSTKDMMKIANLAYKSSASTMQTTQLPPEQFASVGYASNGQWRILPDVNGIRNYVYQTLNLEGTPAVAKGFDSGTSTKPKEPKKTTEAKPAPAPTPAPTPEPTPAPTDGTNNGSENGGTTTPSDNNQTPPATTDPSSGSDSNSTGDNSGQTDGDGQTSPQGDQPSVETGSTSGETSNSNTNSVQSSQQ